MFDTDGKGNAAGIVQIENAIYKMPKDAAIDLLDEYRGAGCYADYSIEELQELLLFEHKRKVIGYNEIIDSLLASN